MTFTITPADLAFVNDVSKTVTEAGEFKIQIGDQQVNFNYISTKNAPSRSGKL